MNADHHEPARTALQQRLDAVPDGGTLTLDNQEYPGPLMVTRSITIEGNGATLWALRGPVLRICGPGVSLRGLRIEVTDEHELGAGEARIALSSEHPVAMERVTVRGDVSGLGAEEGAWRYPTTLYIGDLAPNLSEVRRLRLCVPTACRLRSSISGLEVVPEELPGPGCHEVRLRFEPLLSETLVNGRISLETPLVRRSIMVTARVAGAAGSGAPDALAWQPDDWEALETQSLARSAPLIEAPSAAVQPPSTPPPVARPARTIHVSEQPVSALFATPSPSSPSAPPAPPPGPPQPPSRLLGAAFLSPPPPPSKDSP